MTTEKADEIIDALDSQFEGLLLQMGWPMAPLKTKKPLPTTRRVMRSAITGLTYGPPKGDGWTHNNPSAQIIETHAFITTPPPPVYCHVSPVPRRSMNASGSIVLSRLNQRLEYFSVSPNNEDIDVQLLVSSNNYRLAMASWSNWIQNAPHQVEKIEVRRITGWVDLLGPPSRLEEVFSHDLG